jgi:hypothetical protein
VHQALRRANRISQRHAVHYLHLEAGLQDRIALNRLPSPFAGGLRRPHHVGIEPDRQRAMTLERRVILGPVQGLITQGVRSAHLPQISHSIHKMNP